MFTGLIEATGRVEHVQLSARGEQVRVVTTLAQELRPGDSIAVSGVCLTVTAADSHGFDVDVSPETLSVTTFATIAAGRLVNLERPVRADGRLGGHFVLGHVDAVGRVAEFRRDGEHYWMEVRFPATLAPLLILKGSIAVDGISLTIASLSADRFGVQIVPFTTEQTALKDMHGGHIVNLEADVIGKYVARLLSLRDAGVAAPAGFTRERS